MPRFPHFREEAGASAFGTPMKICGSVLQNDRAGERFKALRGDGDFRGGERLAARAASYSFSSVMGKWQASVRKCMATAVCGRIASISSAASGVVMV